MAVIDLKNTIIQVRGGTTGQKVTVVLGEGNLTYDEKRNMEYIKDRGLLNTVREGDQEPMDVRLDATWDFITGTGGSQITIEDAMKKRNNASAWASSSADACEPYAVDIYILYTPVCGSDAGETIVLPDFRWESISHDAKAGTLSFTGKSNATQAIPTRGTPTT